MVTLKSLNLIPVSEPQGLRIFQLDFDESTDSNIGFVSRFVKFFLTPIGSDPLDLEYGTFFARGFFGTVDPTAIESFVYQSVAYAVEKMQDDDFQSRRLSEDSLAEVVVKQVSVDKTGNVTISLDLYTKAETETTVNLYLENANA